MLRALQIRHPFFYASMITMLISAAQAGQETSSFEFLPGKLLFPPLIANYQEPRTGVRKEIGSSRLKLDIGTTLDLIEYRVSTDGSQKIRMGIDLFTYALTTSAQGLRLQVDAVDGFFGGHLAFRTESDSTAFAIRLRIMHLSAHFVDGHLEASGIHWRDGREPIPFTRDFGELTGAFEWKTSNIIWMLYSGLSYATLVRPVEIQRIATIHGVELHTTQLAGPLFGKPFHLFVAYNLTLTGIPAYVGTNNIELGGKIGAWGGTGLRVYIDYYAGLDIFSQYYDVRRETWGIGIAFDAW